MSEIVDLEKHRLERMLKDRFGEENFISHRPGVRWANAFRTFLFCSAYGKKRQRMFLHEIIERYRLQRPISVDEMTDMLIAYFQEHGEYFERKCGLSMKFDYEKEADSQHNSRTRPAAEPRKRATRPAAE